MKSSRLGVGSSNHLDPGLEGKKKSICMALLSVSDQPVSPRDKFEPRGATSRGGRLSGGGGRDLLSVDQEKGNAQ